MFEVKEYKPGIYVNNVTTGDFNGDGKPDVATMDSSSNNISIYKEVNSSNNISIFFGDGKGSFSPGPKINLGVSPNYFLAGNFRCFSSSETIFPFSIFRSST